MIVVALRFVIPEAATDQALMANRVFSGLVTA